MQVDMVCVCGAALLASAEDSYDWVMLLVTRFTDAHVSCGYLTPLVTDDTATSKSLGIDVKEQQ